jgi:cell division inhibitor SulA
MSIYLFVPVYVHSMGLGGDKVLPLRKLRTPAATAATIVDELILGSYIIVININGLL